MEKMKLDDFSVIIPFKYDSPKRLENLVCVVRFFDKYFKNFELIIVELQAFLDASEIQIPFIHHVVNDPKISFSKASLVNIGASISTKPYLIVCDTDVIIDPKAISFTAGQLRLGDDIPFIIPYNLISFNIKGKLREEVIETLDVGKIHPIPMKRIIDFRSPKIDLKNNKSLGLINLFEKKTFMKVGGFNEEFVSWGYEDNEIVVRYQKLGYQIMNIKLCCAYHLAHPITYPYIEKEQMERNRKQLIKVSKMTKEELISYIATWNRFSDR